MADGQQFVPLPEPGAAAHSGFVPLPEPGAAPTMHGFTGTWDTPTPLIQPVPKSQDPLQLDANAGGLKGLLGHTQQQWQNRAEWEKQQAIKQGGFDPGMGQYLSAMSGGTLPNVNLGQLKNAGEGMMGDVVGLGGQAIEHPIATVVGALAPELSAPYFIYQGWKMLNEPRQVNETPIDVAQRRLLAGSMIAGSAGDAVKMGRAHVDMVRNFTNRTRDLGTTNNSLTTLAQDKLMPWISTLYDKMKERTSQYITGLENAEKTNPQLGTVSTHNMNAADVKWKAPGREPLHSAAANRILEDVNSAITSGTIGSGAMGKGLRQFNVREAAQLYSRLGEEEHAAMRRGDNVEASHLEAIRKGLDADLQERADKLNKTGEWEKFKQQAQSYFDLRRNKVFGPLIEGREAGTPSSSDMLRTPEATQKAAVDKALAVGQAANKNHPNAAPKDLERISEHMKKVGLDPGPWEDAVNSARVLSQLHDQLHSRFGPSLYAIMHGGFSRPALIGIGAYMAAHALHLPEFLPYMLGTMAAASSARASGPAMESIPILRELSKSHPEAAHTMTPQPTDSGPWTKEASGGDTFDNPAGYTPKPRTREEIQRAHDELPPEAKATKITPAIRSALVKEARKQKGAQ